jgi:hypothetical protein
MKSDALDRIERMPLPPAKNPLVVSKPYTPHEEEDTYEVETESDAKSYLGKFFDDEQVDEMLKFWEEKLTEVSVALTEKMPNFLECETLYVEVKTEIDAIRARELKASEMVRCLNEYRSRAKPIKEIKRLLRTTSHTAKAPRQVRREFDWMNYAVTALKKMDKFLDPYILWGIVLQENAKDFVVLKGDLKELKKTQYMVTRNWVKASSLVYKRRVELDECLGFYGEKIGLRSWLDTNGVPLPQYIKDFMHDKT